MFSSRCSHSLFRTMSRCSLRRLVVVTATLSVLATITFFIYSMTLESPGLASIKQGQIVKFRARARPADDTQFEEHHDVVNMVKHHHVGKPAGGNTAKPIMINALKHRKKESKVVEKMSWPDRKKGEKGRKAARVKGETNLKLDPPLESYSDATDPFDVPRVAEYCNLPVREQHGREGEAPPGYSLRSVYMVIRHGDRSPMYSFKTSPNPILSCKYNSSSTFDIPNYNKFESTLQYFQSRLHPGNTFPFHLYPNSQICDNSQLTGQGASQHLLNGWHLHERYVQKWRLFSEPFTPDQVYIKSTGYSRTYQSALALLYTFLPTFNLTDLNIFRSDNLFFCSEKSFGHPCLCQSLKYYKKASEGEAGGFNKNNPDLKRVREHIAKVYNMKRQELPWLWSMIDTLMSYACHKIKLPCNKDGECIEPSTLAELWHQLDLHGDQLEKLESYQKYVRLGIQPLLHEIKQHMLLTTKKKAKVKFALYSGHDTTVSPLSAALGIGNGRWPKYATRIIFELYMREDPKKHHFLRILMNGEDVTSKVSFCKGSSKNGFCKLKYFVDFVQKENLSVFKGKSYAQACSEKSI